MYPEGYPDELRLTAPGLWRTIGQKSRTVSGHWRTACGRFYLIRTRDTDELFDPKVQAGMWSVRAILDEYEPWLDEVGLGMIYFGTRDELLVALAKAWHTKRPPSLHERKEIDTLSRERSRQQIQGMLGSIEQLQEGLVKIAGAIQERDDKGAK